MEDGKQPLLQVVGYLSRVLNQGQERREISINEHLAEVFEHPKRRGLDISWGMYL